MELAFVGNIVSSENLRLFITESLPYQAKYYLEVGSKFKGWEDAKFGVCMLNVGVLPKEIVDENKTCYFCANKSR